jgi:hypothetical protein
MQREPSCSIPTGMMTLIDALRNFAQREDYHHLVILKQNMTTMSETKEHNLFIIYKVKSVVSVDTADQELMKGSRRLLYLHTND